MNKGLSHGELDVSFNMFKNLVKMDIKMEENLREIYIFRN